MSRTNLGEGLGVGMVAERLSCITLPQVTAFGQSSVAKRRQNTDQLPSSRQVCASRRRGRVGEGVGVLTRTHGREFQALHLMRECCRTRDL
jgi:hypothetical protein